MKADKYDATGKKGGKVDLPGDVFAEEFSKAAIYTIVRAEETNRRQGTHKTKERAEISGGGKKPWRQKGTGNARQGTTRAPQWRGGGTVFGPRPKDYEIKVHKQMRKAGVRSIFSSKAARNAVSVIADLSFEEFSTRKAADIFKTMGLIPGGTVCLVVDGSDEKLAKSVGNIPFIRLVHARRLKAPELYYSDHVVLSESALAYIGENYKKKAKAGAA